MTWKVGFLGAGPGVAALHLPTLGRLDDKFRVAHVADAGSGRARTLAEPLHASWSAGDGELLADPDVEVVAICSPPAEHQRQIMAAVGAGKKAIFCEKPLATTKEAAEGVVAACRAAGTVLMVGTNHAYDPGWLLARHLLEEEQEGPESIAVTLALPPNGRYHQLVSENGSAQAQTQAHAQAQAPARERPDTADPGVAAHIVKQLLTGLAVHDLPAVRHFAPDIEAVQYARFVPPIGFAVGYKANGVNVQLALTMLPAGPDVLWRVTFSSPEQRLDLEYPPPFVHAGSGRVSVARADGSRTEYPSVKQDGYEAEWLHFVHLLERTIAVDYDQILADALYPLGLADAVFAAMTTGDVQ
ncbi:oxidoreductase [Arthrobacter sp. StoSoilA2]|uniref:Gfo/Idh/MocA family protein n=1 Tax=Arthrobacter sp. StoSoilA2 TaxID=2830990 RepID=UPI001CC73550|nr:Gfo/Idh/MocA family oxidoreductase [Arthrobacter sp. StoSoilA2]BCW34465.1 oxidoreductase [Arthrobacter sp. StoSoilA2]